MTLPDDYRDLDRLDDEDLDDDIDDDLEDDAGDDADVQLAADDDLDGLRTTEDEDETVDTGDRRPRRDDAEMGLMSEPHSPEELADSAIGKKIPGKRGVTRDGEEHGESFLDPS